MINKKLYLNALKSLRLPGFIMLFACVILSLIMPVETSISMLRYNVLREAPGISEMFFVLIGFIFAGGYLLTNMAFNFLNKRVSSDFYHSIPQKRITIYLSILLAVITWIFAIIIITVTSTFAFSFILSVPVNLNYLYIAPVMFFGATLLVCGATVLGMSVTGTAFSNFITTGLILFLPRFISAFLQIIIQTNSDIFPTESLGMLISPQYNIVAGLVSSAVLGVSVDGMFTNISSIVYTTVLAVIYLIFGAIFFIKRKSESAEKGAPNVVLQNIYRCAITFPILLICPAISYNQILRGSFDMDNIMEISVVVIISLIVYFVYEAVTTKKAKNLVKSIPIYFLLIILTVGISITAHGVRKSMFYDIPETADVESVTFLSNSEFYSERLSYTDLLINDIDFKDHELIHISVNGLKETVEDKSSDNYQYNEESARYKMTFNLKGGRKLSRYVTIKGEDIKRLEELRINNVDYKNALIQIPQEKEVNIYRFPSNSNLKASQVKQLINSLFEEIKGMDNETLKQYTSKIVDNDIYFGNIEVSGSVGFKNYRSNYSITTKTPKTANLYNDMVKYENKEHLEKLIKTVTQDDFEDVYFSVDFQLYDAKTKQKTENYFYNLDKIGKQEGMSVKQLKDVVNVIKENVDNEFDSTDNLLIIQSYMVRDEDRRLYESSHRAICLSINDEQTEIVKNYLTDTYKQEKVQ